MTDTHVEEVDRRTPLQRREDEETAAFEALPKAQKVALLTDEALAECYMQIQHGGPITQAIVDKLEAIRALKAQKVALLTDEALAECHMQIQHGGPITQAIVDKLEAIRALVS